MRLGELAERLGGRPVEGDASVELVGAASLEEGGAAQLGFVRGPEQAAALEASAVGAVIAPAGVGVGRRPVIRSPMPSLDFARAVRLLVPPRCPPPGVHPRAFVAEGARIDPTASVGPLAVVGAGSEVGPRTVVHANATLMEDVRVGADAVLHPGVVLCEGTRIGDRVTLHPGVVIGGDGFGYEFNERGEHEKVPQVGCVVIEDDVEIGANTTVDRARLGRTLIRHGAKIDNLVMVGHNCVIGADAVIVAMVGLSGSTILEDRVIMMGQAATSGHLRIGAGSFVAARAGVIEDLPPGSRVWGFPARPERAWHRSAALLARLPELARRIRRLERHSGIPRDGGEES
jgi:UDP-3-O-[3-hydroxymyristoyl] glucosamine N-acyltransferase